MIAHPYPTRHLGRKQQGVATLLIALIIMVAVTITVIFTAQTTILEQRMSANEIRMKQTSVAAQSGLERAMAYIQTSSIPDVLSSDDANFNSGEYRAAFLHLDASGADLGSIDDVCPADPDDFPGESSVDAYRKTWDGTTEPGPDDTLNKAVLIACGWSDDRSGRKAVMLGMQGGPAVANPPDNPLLARGGIDVSGNAGIYNAYTNLTLRSGREAKISGNAGTTYMRNPAYPPPSPDDPVPQPGPNNPDPMYLEMSAKEKIGLDVVDYDPGLNRGDGDEFFQNFMGYSKEDYKNNVAAHILDGTNRLAIGPEYWGQTLWIDGNGGEVELEGTVGNRDNPVVMVVDGDLRLAGFFEEFHGVLYVTGDLTGKGNPTFFGATVIEGHAEIEDDPTAEIAGRPNFVFDPVAAGGGSGVGARGLISGSWRDWSN